MYKVFILLRSVKSIFFIFVLAPICFGCNRNADGAPDAENESIATAIVSAPANDSIPRIDNANDAIISTLESSSTFSDSIPMIVIESNTSSYHFENQEFYYRAYYDDLRSPPFKFSFYDGFFYMDIPELDNDIIELGRPIKGNLQGQYTIIEENGFIYILVAEKKFLVLFNGSMVCVLIDCQNNDAFFGLNRSSIYVDVPESRGPFVGITGQAAYSRRVSSFLTESLMGNTIIYDGSKEKYYYEITKPWVEGKDDHGIGEWIELRPAGNVCGVVFFNGYINPNRPDLFYANSRIKELLVISEKDSWVFQIQDTPYPQILPLPDSFNAILRFTIMDVYEGNKYEDTCLAGIYFLRIRGQ